MSDIARLLEECGCDCVEYRDLEDHDCLVGKAEFEWVEMKKEIERLREENADLRSRLDEWVNLGNQYLFGNAIDNMVKHGKGVVSKEMLTEEDIK